MLNRPLLSVSVRNKSSEIFRRAGIFIYLLSADSFKKPLNQLCVPAEGNAGNELKILAPFKQQVSSFKTQQRMCMRDQREHLLPAITNSIHSVPPLLSRATWKEDLSSLYVVTAQLC